MRLLIKLTMLLYLADYKMSIANDNLFPHLPAVSRSSKFSNMC